MSYQQPPQQPDWQQPQPPYTHYPQQQTGPGIPPPPQYPMSPVPPPRKLPFWTRKVGCLPMWLLIVLAIVVIGGIGSIANSASQSSTNTPTTQTNTQSTNTQPAAATATPAPTQAPQKWTTTHTFTGNGSKKTAIFTAPDDWKILYSCTFQNNGGVTDDGVLAVSVYNSDASIADPGAVNVTCKNGVAHTTGETEEHQGGQVYLSIDGTGDWIVRVQELK